MKRLLLTGSQGFFASRFLAWYQGQYDFVLLNRHNFDITDERNVFELFKNHKIDIVVHAAAIADTGVCQRDPQLARRINVQSSINIAKGCAMQNSVLVFTGSDQIFSANPEDGPYAEETLPMLGSVYAQTKYEAEREIASLLERVYNLRLTWMFSMPERNHKNKGGILAGVINALLADTPVSLNENDFRGLTYVYDVIESFSKIIELPYGTYHAGSENDLSVYEIGRRILDALHAGHRADAVLGRTSNAKRDLRLSNAKLRAHGVTFLPSEQAIRRCLSEFGF